MVAWTEECEWSFRILKEALAKRPVLGRTDCDRSFLVETNASDRGMGAVLSQKDENWCDCRWPTTVGSFFLEMKAMLLFGRSAWQ